MAAPHSSLDAAKAAMRRHALSRRDAASSLLADCAAPGMQPSDTMPGEALASHLLAALTPPAGAVIAGFWPMGSEIDIRPLLATLHARGHALVLPVTPPRGHPLKFRRWRPGEPLVAGPMGTSQPAAGDPATPDWLLVPLLAFDRTGGRLGYGGGYYDRTLAALPGALAVGVAYAAQEVPAVPVGPDDVRLPLVATEAGLVRCGELALDRDR